MQGIPGSFPQTAFAAPAWAFLERTRGTPAIPNGPLASGSHDGTVRLWDVAGAQELQNFRVENAAWAIVLTGSAGRDWFFANLDGDGNAKNKDKITDLSANEFAEDIDFIQGA
jgi:WD40 repeat protein